jgi:hypothetical protein
VSTIARDSAGLLIDRFADASAGPAQTVFTAQVHVDNRLADLRGTDQFESIFDTGGAKTVGYNAVTRKGLLDVGKADGEDDLPQRLTDMAA